MSDSKNTIYDENLADTVNDAFYSNSSYRGKVSDLRTYAEYVIRKLLNIDPETEITLGKEIQNQIGRLPDGGYAREAINRIKEHGDKCAHSAADSVQKEEYDYTVKALMQLMAFLFIRYFNKYEFGSNNSITWSFSLLPPAFRHTVLEHLYENYPNNVYIINKLSLAKFKTYGPEKAYEWIEQEKNHLSQLNAVDEYGNVIPQLNAYDMCRFKIDFLKNDCPPLYPTFEIAKKYYMENGILPETCDEFKEFNDIMAFMYKGRKTAEGPTKPPIVILLI